MIGTKGVLLIPHVSKPRLFGEAKGITIDMLKGEDHWLQFVNAVQGQGKASANFDYSGPLTEAVLLGSVATRFPKTTLEWDAAALKFPNTPEADRFVRREYREGWRVAGL